jgi:hypothetical protein
VVGVLLYRKHVITEQPYILQLISLLEQVGVMQQCLLNQSSFWFSETGKRPSSRIFAD